VSRYADLAARDGRLLGRRGQVPGEGWFCEPIVATDLPPESPVLLEEVFGPLLAVEPVSSVDAACEAVEASPHALTAGLFSRDPETVRRVVARLPVGNLYVNRSITGAMVGRQPFGGNRLSGVGAKAGGPDYLLQFVDPRVVSENTMRHGLVVD
jgi:RHH-type transcriptional regulator, proline utilization regulon repressor / proline dehydrogenase / delta 1-pyrroline-5-carboxylate dehydrogenase